VRLANGSRMQLLTRDWVVWYGERREREVHVYFLTQVALGGAAEHYLDHESPRPEQSEVMGVLSFSRPSSTSNVTKTRVCRQTDRLLKD